MLQEAHSSSHMRACHWQQISGMYSSKFASSFMAHIQFHLAPTSAAAATPTVASPPPCTVSVLISSVREIQSLTVPPPATCPDVHNIEPVQPPSATSVQSLSSGFPAGTFIYPTYSNVSITIVNSPQAFHEGRPAPEAQMSSQVTTATPSSERPTSSNNPSTSTVT